jgi:hypothetical protein
MQKSQIFASINAKLYKIVLDKLVQGCSKWKKYGTNWHKLAWQRIAQTYKSRHKQLHFAQIG